jgi:hypothetical protein
MRFIAQMLGQLSAQHSLHQADLQFRHQACVAQQILGSFKAAQQLVQKFFGNRHCCHAHLVWKHGVKLLIHKRSDTLQIGGNVERMVAPSRACFAYPAVQGSVVAVYFGVLRDLIPFSLISSGQYAGARRSAPVLAVFRSLVVLSDRWSLQCALHHGETRLCISLPFSISFIANIARKRPELKSDKTSSVHTYFNPESHLYNRSNFKLNRTSAQAEWRTVCSA